MIGIITGNIATTSILVIVMIMTITTIIALEKAHALAGCLRAEADERVVCDSVRMHLNILLTADACSLLACSNSPGRPGLSLVLVSRAWQERSSEQ